MLCSAWRSSNGSDVVVAVVDLEDVDVIVEEVVVVAMVVVIITIEPSRSNSSRSSSSSSVRLEGERSPYSEWGDTAIAVMVVEVVIVA